MDNDQAIKQARDFPQGKGPLLPKAEGVPITDMILHWSEGDRPHEITRVLSNTGFTIRLLVTVWARP